MRLQAKIVNEQLPTAEELAGYSEQMQPVASITDYKDGNVVIETGSIESALYAANFLGIRKVILVFYGATKF